MQSRWKDADARKAVETWAKAGVAEDLALRTYTTRLLGRDPALVLHGGGNTSLKTRMTDLAGETREVLCVKASGRDMAEIDPSGFAAVDLAPLRKLRALDDLSDADMARAQRAWLIDPLAPDPSVEFLLHAFMPHTYIDHTHANAVLALIDREGGDRAGARGLRGPPRARALSPARLRPRQGRRRHLRCRPEGRGPDPRQARHLHVRGERARGLRAHDRDGEPRRGPPAPRQAEGVQGRSPAQDDRQRVGGGADPAWRSKPEG